MDSQEGFKGFFTGVSWLTVSVIRTGYVVGVKGIPSLYPPDLLYRAYAVMSGMCPVFLPTV